MVLVGHYFSKVAVVCLEELNRHIFDQINCVQFNTDACKRVHEGKINRSILTQRSIYIGSTRWIYCASLRGIDFITGITL